MRTPWTYPPDDSLSPAADSYDSLLQVSRRADWRFLLPDPELGRVACVTTDAELAEACSRLAASTVLLSVPEDGEPGAFDIVVLTGPSPADLASAVALLRPGGWIYVELRPPLFRRRGTRDWIIAMERLGLVGVEAHRHWPDFSSAVEIVPLADACAIQNMLLRRTAAASVKKVVARLLSAAGLLGLVAPCASLIGRAPEGTETGR